MIDRHHLLECILWPNGDGTFRKIVNTMKRLDELGIYDDYKLTIPIEHSTHMTMHAEFKKGTEYELSGEKNCMYGRTGDKHPKYGKGYLIAGEKNGMYGKGYLIAGEKNGMYGMTGDKSPMYGRTGDKCPMYGRTREYHPRWKGDKVGPSGLYKRARKLYKSGLMTEEEFQPFRDIWNEHKRQRK